MTRPAPGLMERLVYENSLTALLAKALFIALVSFGGPAGVLIAFFPLSHYQLGGA